MLRPIADQLREYAKHVADGSSTYCEAPIMLLEKAADLIEDHERAMRRVGILEEVELPIDGTGWAEAAFDRYKMSGNIKPQTSPGDWNHAGRRANLWLKPIVGDGIGLTTIAHPGWPDDHLVTDDMDPAQRDVPGRDFSQNALNSYRESIERAAANLLNRGQGE